MVRFTLLNNKVYDCFFTALQLGWQLWFINLELLPVRTKNGLNSDDNDDILIA